MLILPIRLTIVLLPWMLMWGMIETAKAESKWQGETGVETRFFTEEGPWSDYQTNVSLSLIAQYQNDWNDRNDLLSVEVFARADEHDSKRTHADLRELSWTHVGTDWELMAGVGKVFWGVTESYHLVDIINQTDLVEDPDGEDKLGQPMLRLSLLRDWGVLELYALPYFRERTFPGEGGRFRLPIVVDQDHPLFESGAKHHRLDGAIHYRGMFSDLDLSIAHFSGTSRSPGFIFNGNPSKPRLIPYYPVIDQTSLTLQYFWGNMLWKLEATSRSGEGDRYSAAVGGFEYTQVGVGGTDVDLGWILEYLFDERQDLAPVFVENDLFAGWRLTFNDVDSTNLLVGVMWDTQSQERVYSIEGSRRIAESFVLKLKGRAFEGEGGYTTQLAELNDLAHPDGADNKLSFLQSEDYLQLELRYYF